MNAARGPGGARGLTLLESSVDVVLWAIQHRRPLTREDIITRWGVHKSTAWRWLPTLESARQRAQLVGVPRVSSGQRVPIRREPSSVTPFQRKPLLQWSADHEEGSPR